MKTSNIILGVLAGATIGGIVAIILKAERELESFDDDEEESGPFNRIADQFSNKLSSGLETAERKIKSRTNSNEFFKHDEEGVFL